MNWVSPFRLFTNGPRNNLKAGVVPETRWTALFKSFASHRKRRSSSGFANAATATSCEQEFEVLPATNEIVSQFSSLLSRISHAALDSSITLDEAKEIREQWDRLKCFGEGFVRCCEEGDFTKMEIKKEEDPDQRKTLY